MFHFPGCRLARESAQYTTLLGSVGFPIRESWDQRLFAPPPGLSQLTTPFIACWCQGIHFLPLKRIATFAMKPYYFLEQNKEILLAYSPSGGEGN